MGDRGPILTCLEKHGSNKTLGFHDCICNFDYSYARSRDKPLKMKHCHEAAEMYKIGSFYSYVIIIAAIFFGIIAIIAAICSCKWYFKTNKNPCNCCNFFCCCKNKKNVKAKSESVNVFEQQGTGHTWSPINLPPLREGGNPNTSCDGSEDGSTCMNFCLSDPVQDCCEFFDCDIMWRKKSVYTIPIFGRRKQQCHLQKRPTRPAPAPPPPPKAVVLPHVKRHGPIIIDDDMECEPVPEAPPSPEPVRHMPAKALYVDPLSFLQKPFLKMVSEKNEAEEDKNDKQEALYSKFKNMVLSKVKKSASMASINKLGFSDQPDGFSDSPSGQATNSRRFKTASLASLSNLGDPNLDPVSYGSKRSLSLASLHMFQQDGAMGGVNLSDPRCRISVVSNVTDDIPPSARKDEYIDLEEMSKRIEAKMRAAQLEKDSVASAQIAKMVVDSPSISSLPNTYTPNFIPASAFSSASSSFNPNQQQFVDKPIPAQYYPPVPASQGKPAVPARTAIGSPIYSMSPAGTLNRPKPVVPPRPLNVDGGPNSPRLNMTCSRSSTLTRSPRLMKPSDPPPPPPPGSRPPIESSI